MPTAFDPEQAVTTGLLGATGPVQVTIVGSAIDYFDYTKKDGTITARTVAGLLDMAPDGDTDEKGNQKSYKQVYSIGDVKSHHPNPDKATFEGPLVKSSNFNFFLENLINAGFPKHLLAAGDIRVLNGAVLVVEQKKPPSRNIQGQASSEQANKGVVVATKVIHPAPGEDWPATGKAVSSKAGVSSAAKAAVAPKKALSGTPTTAPATPTDDAVSGIAEKVMGGLIAKGGENGYTYGPETSKQATLAYMKLMQSDAASFPANQRANVVKLCQDAEWLGGEGRPWMFDAESGVLIAG